MSRRDASGEEGGLDVSDIILTAGNHEIDGNMVTVTGSDSVSTYRIPRKAARVTSRSAGRGRKRLTVGGFKSVTVSVVGPTATIEQLRKEVVG